MIWKLESPCVHCPQSRTSQEQLRDKMLERRMFFRIPNMAIHPELFLSRLARTVGECSPGRSTERPGFGILQRVTIWFLSSQSTVERTGRRSARKDSSTAQERDGKASSFEWGTACRSSPWIV